MHFIAALARIMEAEPLNLYSQSPTGNEGQRDL